MNNWVRRFTGLSDAWQGWIILVAVLAFASSWSVVGLQSWRLHEAQQALSNCKAAP